MVRNFFKFFGVFFIFLILFGNVVVFGDNGVVGPDEVNFENSGNGDSSSFNVVGSSGNKYPIYIKVSKTEETDVFKTVKISSDYDAMIFNKNILDNKYVTRSSLKVDNNKLIVDYKYTDPGNLINLGGTSSKIVISEKDFKKKDVTKDVKNDYTYTKDYEKNLKDNFNSNPQNYISDNGKLTELGQYAVDNGALDNIGSKQATNLVEDTDAMQQRINAFDACPDKNECKLGDNKLNENEIKIDKKKLSAMGNLVINLPSSKIYELSGDNVVEYAKIKNKEDCKDAVSSYLCEAFTTTRETVTLKNTINKDLTDLNNQYNNGDLTKDEYNNQVNKKYVDFLNGAKGVDGLSYDAGVFKLDNSDGTIYSKPEYNEASGETIMVPTNTFDSVDELIQSVCDGSHPDKCKALKDRNDIANDRFTEAKRVENSVTYDIMSFIMNPDQNGLDAARLFGWEANYTDLPYWAKKSFPSQICDAKIHGYLDKSIENSGGGTTQFGSCSEKLNETSNVDPGLCREITSDLRAQATSITPDKTVGLTYSLFLKSNVEQNLYVIVGLSYVRSDNGQSEVKKLDTFNLTAKTPTNKYYSNNFNINLSKEQVDENSFRVTYGAFLVNTTTKAMGYSVPVIMMNYDNALNSVYSTDMFNNGNSAENSKQSNNVATSVPTDSDLLGLI